MRENPTQHYLDNKENLLIVQNVPAKEDPDQQFLIY